MAISPTLIAHLGALTASIDQPDLDLGHQLDTFAATVRAAVPSYRGMRLTVHVHDLPITFTHRDSDNTTDIETSVLVPLTDPAGAADLTTLVLWAATPGAFVDLAADLSYLLGVPLAALELDAHRGPSTIGVSGIAGIDDFSVVNQAIGVLIARGATPEAAAVELGQDDGVEHRVRAARTVVGSAGDVHY